MDQKEHIEDIGSHEDKLMLDGPYLNHEDNALNDDLKLPQGPITRSRVKKFKEALQGFMRNIWDNHLVIGFGCIFTKKGFPTKGNLSYMRVEMDRFKSLNTSMIMLIV